MRSICFLMERSGYGLQIAGNIPAADHSGGDESGCRSDERHEGDDEEAFWFRRSRHDDGGMVHDDSCSEQRGSVGEAPAGGGGGKQEERFFPEEHAGDMFPVSAEGAEQGEFLHAVHAAPVHDEEGDEDGNGEEGQNDALPEFPALADHAVQGNDGL